MNRTPSKRDDAALLHGDPGAFAELYRRHEDAILGYFLGRTRDAELAADLSPSTRTSTPPTSAGASAT